MIKTISSTHFNSRSGKTDRKSGNNLVRLAQKSACDVVSFKSKTVEKIDAPAETLASLPGKLSISFPVTLKLSDVRNILAESLADKELTVSDKLKVKINKLDLQVEDKKLKLITDFKITEAKGFNRLVNGSSGHFVFTAIPSFNSTSQTLKLESIGLNMDLDGLDGFIFSFPIKLFNNSIAETLKSRLETMVNDRIKDINQSGVNLQEAFNNAEMGGIKASTKVKNISVTSLDFNNDNVSLMLSIGGDIGFVSPQDNVVNMLKEALQDI